MSRFDEPCHFFVGAVQNFLQRRTYLRGSRQVERCLVTGEHKLDVWIETAGSHGRLHNDSAITALADRRLAQIRHMLRLEADHFERAHGAALSSDDGSYEKILSEQAARIARALPRIEDALLRERVTSLIVALADSEPHQL